MKLHRASKEYASIDVTADVNLTAATLEVSIGTGQFTPWDWTGPAVAEGGSWSRTGRALLAGPDADPGNAVVLPVARHRVRYRLVGIEPEQPAREADPIDVA